MDRRSRSSTSSTHPFAVKSIQAGRICVNIALIYEPTGEMGKLEFRFEFEG